MKKEVNKKFYLEADIKIQEETAALRERANSIINLPDIRDKQPDLLYFSAIFVSSGENLNHAYFLTSELIKSEGTIINKALDVEHEEDQIIGHIYDRAFMDKEGKPLSVKELASMELGELDRQEVHIAIAGILYKSRFPNIAEEVVSGKWKVSMEAYYQDYDVKVGDLILDKKEAEALGLASEEGNIFGKIAKVIKSGKKIAQGAVTRVLRGIVFSGVGIVKHPANTASVILETANNSDENEEDKSEIILNLDDNNVTSINTEESVSDGSTIEEDKTLEHKDKSELQYNDTVGICVSYKKEVIDATFKGPGVKVLHEDWCSLYEKGCTSFSRDTTDPECLKNKIKTKATAYAKKLLKTKKQNDNRKVMVGGLLDVLDKASKYI